MKLGEGKRTERILIVAAIVAAALMTFVLLKATGADAQTTTTTSTTICDKTTSTTSSTSTSTTSSTTVTAGPVATSRCDCDIDADGDFIVTDVLTLLAELVGFDLGICADVTPAGVGAVNLVWRGPPAAAVDFIVAYDSAGFAAECDAGEGLLASQNHDTGSEESRFAAVDTENWVDGRALFTCVLAEGQAADGMMASVTDAANFDLDPIAGGIEIVPK